MSTVQIVFLFDVSAFQNFRFSSRLTLDEALLSVRLVCLRLLTNYANHYCKIKWGFKFFNSLGSLSQSMNKYSFSDFTLESFENLEAEICRQYERYMSFCKALVLPQNQSYQQSNICKYEEGEILQSSNTKFNSVPVKILNLALTQILCEYQWDAPDICSPVRQPKNRLDQGHTSIEEWKKNYVFLIANCPENQKNLSAFLGVTRPLTVSSIQELLMPSPLYKKFFCNTNINLVWIDTSELSVEFKVSESFLETMQSINNALKRLSGALIPLKILAQQCWKPQNHSKTMKQKSYFHNSLSLSNCHDYETEDISCGILLPFSSVSDYCIERQKHSYTVENDEIPALYFTNNRKMHIQMMVTHNSAFRNAQELNDAGAIPNQPSLRRRKVICLEQNRKAVTECKVWKKFSIRGTVEDISYDICCSDVTYVCWPIETDHSATNNMQWFVNIMKCISLLRLSLILNCETTDGFITSGLLSYLTPTSATIVILDPLTILMMEKKMTFSPKSHDADESKTEILNLINNEAGDLSGNNDLSTNRTEGEILDRSMNDFHTKAFQIVSTENWFLPKLEVSGIVGHLKQQRSKETSYVEKLQAHYRPKFSSLKKNESKLFDEQSSDKEIKSVSISQRVKKSHRATLNVSNRSAVLVERSFHVKTQDFSLCSSDEKEQSSFQTLGEIEKLTDKPLPFDEGFTEEQLLQHLREIYDSALESNRSLLTTVQTIVSVSLGYIQAKSLTEIKETAYNFVKSHFCLSASKIKEKYEGCLNSEYVSRRIKEYQIQTILALELEATLSPMSSDCIEKVTALLRTMSFISDPAELNRFLQDTVKENYCHTLYHILIEIGEELNVPIFPELFSPSSIPESDSSINTNITNSVISYGSSHSSVSSSSMTSQKDNRNNLCQNVITFGNHQKRQIMVPGQLLRKKTKQLMDTRVQTKARRLSPRLALKSAAKRQKELHKHGNQEIKKVCRNLFDTDRDTLRSRANLKHSIRTVKQKVRKNGHQTFTPNGHHILKTKFVPETPSPKQGPLALQRKQARLRERSKTVISVGIVEESPVKMQSNISTKMSEHIHKIQRKCSFYGEAEKCIYENCVKDNNCVPQYKQRSEKVIPEKLFSELLDSPTLQPHSRNCSKRLFSPCTLTRSREFASHRNAPNNKNEFPTTPKTSRVSKKYVLESSLEYC